MESVWVLSSTVISPNNDILNVRNTASSFTGNLTNGSSLIKTGHSSKVLFWNRRSIGGSNESVGVSWVSDHANLDSLLGNLVEGSPLSLENFGVGLQKVGSLHSGASWSGADHKAHVDVLEPVQWVGGGNDLVHAAVGTVAELHAETLQWSLGLGKLNQLEDDFLVGSEHAALSDEVAQESSDLSSSARDGHSDWVGSEVLGLHWEVAAELGYTRGED